MAEPEKQPPTSLAPMPCPAYLLAAHREDEGWRVVSYRVLFAQHDGESAKLYVSHPGFGGLVTVDQVSAQYPAVVLIEPSPEEFEEAMLIVRAKAVAGEQKKRTGRDSDGWGGGRRGL